LNQRFKFERGELDHLRQFHAHDLRTYKNDPRWQPYGQWEPAKGVEGVFLNTQMKPFDNVELRRAFISALDWAQIVSPRPDSLVATQMVPPGLPGHVPGFRGQTHDVPKALVHMRNAGYAYDPVTKKGGYPEAVTFIAPTDTAVVENFAPIMQQQLSRIGIRMRIEQTSYTAFLAETSKRGRAELGYAGWSMDFPDASDFFEPTLSSDAIQDEESQNRAFFSNAEFDALLKRAHGELDPAVRAALYRQCAEIVDREAPWAIGFHQRWYEVVQPYVHDYAVDAKHTEDMRRVWIDAEGRGGRPRFAMWRDVFLYAGASNRASPAQRLASTRPWGRR
jgi:ABC-type transport system substrate-binding protein